MILGILLVLVSGCSSLKELFGLGNSGEEIEAPPQTMAYEGMEQLESENYKTAVETFQKLKDRYPYSKYALLAELKLADAMFLK
ncbi:MAG: outer membrane protein assembly factor BamD, partial [Deltaproteobacteria bacterium]|nr:outer membrane protein assembly factor BamD [Deltaproteobacteria bacterium]